MNATTPPYRQLLWLSLALLPGLAMVVATGWFAYENNHGFGFPLDDAWIHLQFAKNLRAYGAFSYFENRMVTSGSTSPLFTFFLALGLFVTNNEMVLAYCFGTLFLLVGAVYLFRIVHHFSGLPALSAGAALLYLLDPHIQWITLSGMETTCFIAGLLVAWYYFLVREPYKFGIAAGLLIWIRPEGLLFLVVLLLDAAYQNKGVAPERTRKREERPSLRWMKSGIVAACILYALYAAFNLWLSGTVFPNTMAAKAKYYASTEKNFPGEVFQFLSGGHASVYFWLELLGAAVIAVAIGRRRKTDGVTALLWPLLLFGAYWRTLPVVYQEGRYLLPMVPFLLVLGVAGIRQLVDFFGRFDKRLSSARASAMFTSIILFAFTLQFAYASWQGRGNYADYCKYITDRQVAAGRWIHDNLPAGAVVGTHDVGAIAFYSGRRVADMVGLVSPEMIENIGSLDRLRSFLVKKKVTHLALLRNWFEVDNEPIIFQTDTAHPEIMQIAEFHPSRTHFVPQNVTRMRDAAISMYDAGDYPQAGNILQQAYSIDPQSAHTIYWIGKTLVAMGRAGDAEQATENALRLFPGFTDARLLYADLALRRNDPAEAVRRLDGGRRISRDSLLLERRESAILRANNLDSARAVSAETQSHPMRESARP